MNWCNDLVPEKDFNPSSVQAEAIKALTARKLAQEAKDRETEAIRREAKEKETAKNEETQTVINAIWVEHHRKKEEGNIAQ